MVESLLMDEVDVDSRLSPHPCELLGVDPFDFCSYSRTVNSLDHAKWPTLTERVVKFFENYSETVREDW